MGRSAAIAWTLTAAVVLAAVPAYAQRTYKVRIESEPEGAKVYVDDPDSEPIGETPFSADLPAGEATLIFVASGHETLIESLRVKKTRRKQKMSVTLEKKAVGFLKVRPADAGETLEGATVLIDDVERNVEVDEKIELEVGAHKLEVVRDGFETYEAYFELEEGQLQAISVNFVPEGERGGDDGGFGVAKKKKKKEEPEKPVAPASVSLVSAWGGFEWGGRDFRYDAGATNLRDYNFLGARFRVGGAVHPLKSYGVWLGGIGLGGTAGFLLGPKSSSNDNGTPGDPSDDLNANNGWLDYHVDLRYRYDFAEEYYAAVALGLAAEKFEFSNVDPGLEGRLAGVSYKTLQYSLLLGGRIAEKADLYASFHLYQVRDAGEVQSRFTSAAISAFGFDLAGTYPVYDQVEIAARLFYDRYSYTFGAPPAAVDYTASSAVDQFFGLTLGVGYRL